MSDRAGPVALVLRHLPNGALTSVLVSVLIAVSVFAAAAAPRAMQALGTAELRYELEQLPANRLAVLGSGHLGYASSGEQFVTMLEGTDEFMAGLRDDFASPAGDGIGDATWLARTAAKTGTLPGTSLLVPSIKFAIDLHWQERVELDAGAAPGDWVEGSDAPIPIALSSSAADQLGVDVGDLIEFDPAPLEVAGIYSPVDPAARYWVQERDLGEGIVVQQSGAPPTVQASAYVSDATAGELRNEFASGTLSVFLPVDAGAYRFADADALAQQLRQAESSTALLPESGELNLRSALVDVLEEVVGRVASTAALVSLSVSGLAGLLLAVFGMCVGAVIARRRTALALVVARGASALQVRAIMVLEGLLIAVPLPAIAFALAAIVFPGPVGADAVVLPLAVGLAVPVLFAVLTTTGRLRDERSDLRARSSSPVRWLFEVATIGLAITSLVLLQRRGLVDSSAAVGVDPLIVSAPLLLVSAVSVVVLRLYPLPLRWLEAALARGSWTTALVGAARAIRSPIVGFAAVLALLVGMSVVVFSVGMVSTVRAGLEAGARDEVGADVQVQAHDLPATLVADLAALDEVSAAVAVTTESDIPLSDQVGPSQVTVVLADTESLHAVRPDIPVLAGAGAGQLGILVSSDLVDRIEGDAVELVNSQADIAGVLPADALPGLSRRWVLVDESAAPELGLEAVQPDRILLALAPGADDTAAVEAIRSLVTAAQPERYLDSISVESASALQREIALAPSVSGVQWALLIAAIASLALTLVTVVLASVGAATSRNRAVGLLSILGMTSREIRALIAWELAPVAVVAAVVGTAVGALLPLVVTSVLDLSEFLGGGSPPGPHLDPILVGAAVAVFGVVVALAGVLASALGRRFAPAGTLKMGEA